MMNGYQIKNEIQRIAGVASQQFMTHHCPYLDAKDRAGITGVRFDWGHPVEIVQRLQQFTNSETMRYSKFPLIVLYTDFTIRHRGIGDYDTVTLEMVICNYTDPNYQARERELKNFRPILYPIRDYFFSELKNSAIFVAGFDGDIQYDSTDRFYWGRRGLYGNNGNVYNDYVDAIHITNLKLKLNSAYC